MSPRSVRLALALVLLTGAACETTNRAAQVMRTPGAATPGRASEVSVRGPYLDAMIGDVRFFFPDTEECRAVIVEGADVEYVQRSVLGEVRRGDAVCEPIGIGSLVYWQKQQPRVGRKPVTSAQAVYWETYRDASVVLLRGRFPLATRARMRGDDVIAVIDADRDCVETPAEDRQTGTMLYKQVGPVPFELRMGGRRCPIRGFIRPVGPS